MSHVIVSRSDKAVALAADAGQWLKCRTVDGRKFYGIRSSRNANHVYIVSRLSCSCFDARRHDCKHQLAVRLHCQFVAEQEVQRVAPLPEEEDVFKRFEDDPTTPLSRILGRAPRGIVPASQILRED